MEVIFPLALYFPVEESGLFPLVLIILTGSKAPVFLLCMFPHPAQAVLRFCQILLGRLIEPSVRGSTAIGIIDQFQQVQVDPLPAAGLGEWIIKRFFGGDAETSPVLPDGIPPDGDRSDPGIGCPGKHGSNKLRGTVKTDPAKLWQGNMVGIFKPHVAGQLFFAVQVIVGIRLVRLFTAFLLKSRHAPVLLLLVLPCRAVVLDGIGDRLFINFFPIQERQCILDPVHRMGNRIQVIDPFPVDRDHPCSFAQPVAFVPAGDQMVVNGTFCPVIDSDQMFLQV